MPDWWGDLCGGVLLMIISYFDKKEFPSPPIVGDGMVQSTDRGNVEETKKIFSILRRYE